MSVPREIVDPTTANGQGIKRVTGNRSRLEFNGTPPPCTHTWKIVRRETGIRGEDAARVRPRRKYSVRGVGGGVEGERGREERDFCGETEFRYLYWASERSMKDLPLPELSTFLFIYRFNKAFALHRKLYHKSPLSLLFRLFDFLSFLLLPGIGVSRVMNKFRD